MRVFFRITALLLAALTLLSPVPARAAGEEGPDVSAGSAILIEADGGTVLYEKNADEERKIASTTKIMTALTAIEHADLSEITEVPPEAAGVEGSSVYLYAGEKITLENLLYAMMLQSANDASAALAIAVGGDEENFVSMMNRRAASLGLSHTRFDNPHGLDTATNHSTARELACITREALKNETFRTVVKTKKRSVPLHDGSASRLLVNHNRLLSSYSGMIGVKTGYTKKSGRCLVTAAEREGLTLIAVTLDAPDDWNDHRRLLDYGFSRYARFTPLEAYAAEKRIPVLGGAAEDTRAVNLLPFSYIGENRSHTFEIRLRLPRFLYAPVTWGEQVGEAVILDGGEEIGRVPLIAAEGVPARKERHGLLARLLAWIGSLFQR